MKINILHLINGAKSARGTTVIIDVFRAFSVEAYLMSMGAERIYPVGTVAEALAIKEKYPDALLCGERGGEKIEGFDLGNSPTEIESASVRGRKIIHTTSAGTQGVVNATGATEIIGGNLVCAKAISDYIRATEPEEVSLVCMGLAGKHPTEEDTLAAEYIKSLIERNPLSDIAERIDGLRLTEGKKFFDPSLSKVFPTGDFARCTRLNAFPFILKLNKEEGSGIAYMERVDIASFHHRRGKIPPESISPILPGDRITKFTVEEVYSFAEDSQAQVVYESERELPDKFDYAIVLGGCEEYISSRATAAAKLYFGSKCNLFFTSGGVLRDTPLGVVTEAAALKNEMVRLGVPDNIIIEESFAVTTIENMTFTAAAANNMIEESRPSVAVVTSRFHARRGAALAKRLISNARVWGIGADFPLDDPDNFKYDTTLRACVEKECRLLRTYVDKDLIDDFVILN